MKEHEGLTVATVDQTANNKTNKNRKMEFYLKTLFSVLANHIDLHNYQG